MMNQNTQAGPQSSWGAILLIYAIGVLGATSISQVVPIVGDLGKVFHLSRPQGGWVISTPSAVVALGALLFGWFVDKVGDKPMLLSGCAVLVLGDLGVTLAGSVEMLYAMRVLEGIGYVAIAVAAVTMLTRTTQGARRTSALTLWSSFVPMSFALPLILAAQLAGTGHWRWAFTGHGIALAALGIAAAAWLPTPARARTASRISGLATVVRSPSPYLLGLAFACGAFMQTGVVSTLPHMLAGRFGVSFGLASAIGTLGMVFNTIGALAVGPLLNRGTSALAVSVLGVLLALIGGIALYVPGPAFALAVAASSVFFLGTGIIVGLWALLPRIAPSPSSVGATSGLVTQIVLWGVLFGPPAAFAAAAADDWTRPVANLVIGGVACLLLLWLVIRRIRRSDTSDGTATLVQAAH
jgi:predicted MFS family arabinose efflux permease